LLKAKLMDLFFQILSVFLLCFGGAIIIFFLVKEVKEVRFLKGIMRSVTGEQKFKNKENLIDFKNFLNTNVRYDSNQKEKKRPLLRHTASEILKMNYGFCGENARVAIKMMILGGVRANRIYIYGKKWGHVVVEQKWSNKWFLFDGHYDPLTKMEDDYVVSINSSAMEEYPNGYPENPYVSIHRVKLFKLIKPLQSFSNIRLPKALIYYFESPYLIKISFGVFLVLLGILIYFIK